MTKVNDLFSFSSYYLFKLLNNNKYYNEIIHRNGYLNTFSYILPHGKYFFELNQFDHIEFLNIFFQFVFYLYHNNISIFINSTSLKEIYDEISNGIQKEKKKKEHFTFLQSAAAAAASVIHYYDFSLHISIEYREHLYLPWKHYNFFSASSNSSFLNLNLPKYGQLKLKIYDNFTMYYYHITSSSYTSTNLPEIFRMNLNPIIPFSSSVPSATESSPTSGTTNTKANLSSSIHNHDLANTKNETSFVSNNSTSSHPNSTEIKNNFLNQLLIRKKFFIDNNLNINYSLILSNLIQNKLK